MRVYDIELKCGCLVSSDAGGGLIPCCYPGYGASKEEEEACCKAWKEWKKTEDYKEHLKEIQERNR